MMRPSLPWIRRCPLMWPEFLGRFVLIDNDIHQDPRFCYLLLKLLIKNKAAFSIEFYRKCNEINQNGARRKKNQFCGTKDSPKPLYKEKQAVSQDLGPSKCLVYFYKDFLQNIKLGTYTKLRWVVPESRENCWPPPWNPTTTAETHAQGQWCPCSPRFVVHWSLTNRFCGIKRQALAKIPWFKLVQLYLLYT